MASELEVGGVSSTTAKLGSSAGSAHGDADDLIVGNGSSTNAGITFNTPSAGGYLYFADGSSGDDFYRGFIKYVHSGNAMEFGTNAVSRLAISSTGLATFSGDTKIGDGLVANYVKQVAGLDATVAISFTFPSQSSRYIHQMLELRVAMGDDGAATATPTFLRYAFTTLTTASGITQMDASLGAGITASTGASGTTFTVTLTEGSAISMDNVTVFATVTSGHADAKCTGMTVA